MKDGKPWGKGYILYSSGNSYTGDFVNGKEEGLIQNLTRICE